MTRPSENGEKNGFSPSGFPRLEIKTGFRDPGRYDLHEHLKKALLEAVRHRVSDVFIQPGEPILIKVHGQMFSLGKKRLDYAEVESIAGWLADKPDAVASLAQRRPLNPSYEMFDPVEKDATGARKRYRFRVNLTAHDWRGAMGIQAVLRYIESEPPRVEDLNIDPEIIEAMTPRNGICYVTGETGSGKTTTFAGMMRYIAENDTPIKGNIVTGEQPIEFKYDTLPRTHSIFMQSEIGRHFDSFADFVKEDMRRAPALIMVGEARDQETIEAAIEASNTGHPVWTTVHSKSVASTFRRLVSRVNRDQQGAILFDIITTAQLVVSQTLVPRVGGGRYPLREYLVINESIRNSFYDVTDPNRISSAVQLAVEKRGRTMESVSREAFQKGIITEDTHKLITRSYAFT